MPYQNKTNNCPICHVEWNPEFIQDYKNKDGNWSLYQCNSCQAQAWLPFKNPGPEWYEMESGYLVRDTGRPYINRGYHKKALSILEKEFKPGLRLLDVGCGTGEFLSGAQKIGFNVWGVDFDQNAIHAAKRYFNLSNLYCSSVEEFAKRSEIQKFDVITFFEVIEHLDNPIEFVREISKMIKSGGLLILSTPSRERVLVNNIKADFPYHHLSRWNEQSIINNLSKLGFKKRETHYVEQFSFILNAMSEKLRFGTTEKFIKSQCSDGKINDISKRTKASIKLIHWMGYAKDYIIFGIPAVIVYYWGLITGKKNGDMLLVLEKD